MAISSRNDCKHPPRMRSRQLFVISPALYGELLIAIAALKLAEAVHRHTRRTRHKLQKAESQFIGKRVHGHPEPLYDTMLHVIFALERRINLPVFYIYIAKTTEQQLELFRVEQSDASLRYDLVEAFHEAAHLFFDAMHEPPLNDQIDEFLLVLIGHLQIYKESWLKWKRLRGYDCTSSKIIKDGIETCTKINDLSSKKNSPHFFVI